MKQTISKLALTLGLILMFGSSAWAAPAWDDTATSFSISTEGTTSPNATTWYVMKTGNYYLYKDGSSWKATTTAPDPASLTLTQLKNYAFCFTNGIAIQNATGSYIVASRSGTSRKLSMSNNSANWEQTNSKYYYEGILDNYYLYINNGTPALTTTKTSGADWTMYPIEFIHKTPEYTVEYKGVPAGKTGGFTWNGTASERDGNTITTKLSKDDIVKNIVPTDLNDGSRTSVNIDGTTITITYTYPTEYTVTYVPAEGVTGDFGFSINTSNKNIVSSTAETFKTFEKITKDNAGDYVTPVKVDNCVSTFSVSNDNVITITYLSATQYEVVFVFPEGATVPKACGFTVKNGAEKGANNTFSAIVEGGITATNYTNYITLNDLTGYGWDRDGNPTVSGNTITVKYKARTAQNTFDQGYLRYTVTKTGEVSVKLTDLGKQEATAITIPATVSYGNNTYDVTEIAAFGFTTRYGSSSSSRNADQDKAIAKYLNGKEVTAIGYYTTGTGDNKEATHTWCDHPEERTDDRDLTDMDISDEDFKSSAVSIATGTNSRYSKYFHGFNPNLVSVEFEEGCKIKTIQNDAFCGCWNLESFSVPFSVEEIKNGAFGGCINMKSFQFAVGEVNGIENRTKLTYIADSLFIHCESLTSLRIPEGISKIGNRSFQYMLRINKMELPSTLTEIGGEFMCTALSLTSISIPASVTKIGGSAFHGCEALSDVYLLGPPSSLKMNGEYSNVKTFGSNNAYCAKALNNCTFHVLPQYLYSKEEIAAGYRSKKPTDEGYKEAYNGTYSSDILNSWGTVDGDNSETARADGNYFTSTFPEVKKTYVPGQWVTFCMPESEIFFEITDADGKLANQSFVDLNEETKAKVQKEQSSEIDPTPGGQENFVKERPAATTDAASGFLKYNFEYGWDKYDGFGPGCEVAIMTDAWEDAIDPNLYHARFDLINIDQIQPNTPYLICPMLEEGASQADLNICLWTDEDMRRKEFVDNMGAYPHTITKHTEGTHKDSKLNPGHKKPAYVNMIGQIDRGLTNALQPYDIYFKSAGPGWVTDSKRHIGDFKMVPEGGTTYLHSCSAYWNVVVEEGKLNSGGYVSQVKLGSVAEFDAVPADPTAINEIQNDKPARIVVDGIYDMNGRKLDVDQSQLPQGMYIVNGKKVLNK
ncbi:MAG: leucine-rich repeat domain-containing protein [Bacteroidaceae bacterium]|nr:leucine-rich repeat domain-containing protein [Bacteroidaceae bacterium]